MTGPIVPADQWPEGAVALVWNDEGHGRRLTCVRGEWALEADMTPMPAGHDWRVPLIRADMGNPMSAPAIDLEQFRAALVALSDYAYERHGNTDHPHCLEADHLLALIDGQARLNEPFGNSEQLPPCKIEKPRKGEGE